MFYCTTEIKPFAYGKRYLAPYYQVELGTPQKAIFHNVAAQQKKIPTDIRAC